MWTKKCFIPLVDLGLILTALNCSQSSEPYEGSNQVWPQWRGPNRDGISTETKLFKSRSLETPKILWRTEIGEGFSGIAIAHRRVYTMFADGSGDYLGCFSSKTGKELWRVWIGDRFKVIEKVASPNGLHGQC